MAYAKQLSPRRRYQKFSPTPRQATALLKYIEKLEEKAEVESYGNSAWTETAGDAVEKLVKISRT